jgi:hypothetical protein
MAIGRDFLAAGFEEKSRRAKDLHRLADAPQ